MVRAITLAYGAISYFVFLVSFVYAIGFLGNFVVPKGIDTGSSDSTAAAVIVDLILMALFAIQHSIMARPGFKRCWTRLVPWPVERSTYVLFASLILLLLYWQWRPIPGVVWNVSAPFWSVLFWISYGAGWAIVFVSTFMIGHFELLGLTQVHRTFRGEELPSSQFREPGFYKLVRHPIMLGFIIAFWATPHMSLGHALFAAVTTAYIVVAIQFEESDLMTSLGDAYGEYRARIPALIPFAKGFSRRAEAADAREGNRGPK